MLSQTYIIFATFRRLPSRRQPVDNNKLSTAPQRLPCATATSRRQQTVHSTTKITMRDSNQSTTTNCPQHHKDYHRDSNQSTTTNCPQHHKVTNGFVMHKDVNRFCFESNLPTENSPAIVQSCVDQGQRTHQSTTSSSSSSAGLTLVQVVQSYLASIIQAPLQRHRLSRTSSPGRKVHFSW